MSLVNQADLMVQFQIWVGPIFLLKVHIHTPPSPALFNLRLKGEEKKELKDKEKSQGTKLVKFMRYPLCIMGTLFVILPS